MQNSYNVEISLDAFAELVKKVERLSIVERMINGGKYTTIEDIKIVLDIREVNKENETE